MANRRKPWTHQPDFTYLLYHFKIHPPCPRISLKYILPFNYLWWWLRDRSLLFSRISCPVNLKFLNSLTEIYFIYHTTQPFKAYSLMAFSIALPSSVEFQSGFWEYSGCFLWKTIQLGSVVHSECLVSLGAVRWVEDAVKKRSCLLGGS